MQCRPKGENINMNKKITAFTASLALCSVLGAAPAQAQQQFPETDHVSPHLVTPSAMSAAPDGDRYCIVPGHHIRPRNE